MAADLFSDFPERFAERRRVFAWQQDGSRRELQIEDFWAHKGRVILKFAGVNSISDAEALVGSEIQVPAQERTQLEPGTHYVGELVGCEVWVEVAGGQKRVLGTLTAVQFGAGTAPLLSVDEHGREHLIPFAQEYVKAVDTSGKRIELALPEGMLEINAPVRSAEQPGKGAGSQRTSRG